MKNLRQLIENQALEKLPLILNIPFIIEPQDMNPLVKAGDIQREKIKIIGDKSYEGSALTYYLISQLRGNNVYDKEIQILESALPEIGDYLRLHNERDEKGKPTFHLYKDKIIQKLNPLKDSNCKKQIEKIFGQAMSQIDYCKEYATFEIIENAGFLKEYLEGNTSVQFKEGCKDSGMIMHHIGQTQSFLKDIFGKILNVEPHLTEEQIKKIRNRFFKK